MIKQLTKIAVWKAMVDSLKETFDKISCYCCWYLTCNSEWLSSGDVHLASYKKVHAVARNYNLPSYACAKLIDHVRQHSSMKI